MATKVWYSLSRSKILNKARTFNGPLRDSFITTFKNIPDKKGGVIGDKNWNGKGNWMIKVSDKNLKWITTNVKSPWQNGKETGQGKEVTYQIPTVKNGKDENLKIRFRKSSKIEETKAGTEEQEKGSAFIFRKALNDNASWDKWQDIVEDEKTYNGLVEIFNGDVPEDWLISYFAQQKVLLNEVKPPKYSEFDHSGKGSFMEFITKLVLSKFNKSLNLGGKKDSWSPADIWIVSGNQESIRDILKNSVEGKFQTILELNNILRRLYDGDGGMQVMGISLKKTGKTAYYERVNLQKDGMIPDTKNYNYNVPMSDFYANFLIDSKTDMFTQDVKITVDAEKENKTFSFQIKANSSDAIGGSNLKFEPTMKGASSARLGKAPVEQVVKILKEIKSTSAFVNNHKLYPKDLKTFETDKDRGEVYFTQVLNKLTKGNTKITSDIADVKIIIENIKLSYGTPMDRGTNVKAKLMGLDFFYQVSKLDKEQRNEFITDMIFLAQKKATKKMDFFGPFGKIY